MNVCDTPTVVCVNGKPITKIVKNREAKTIAVMLKQTGTKSEDISFQFPKNS